MDIETTLNKLEMNLESFSGLTVTRSQQIKEDTQKSNIKKLILKTNKIYEWVQLNGSFKNGNHSNKYSDAMAKWSVLLDDLFWAIFGHPTLFNTVETNKMKIIWLKILNIDEHLVSYIPSNC